MKNVFLFSWLLCAVTICSYGQFVPDLQNNNWVFGNSLQTGSGQSNLYRFNTAPAVQQLDTQGSFSNPSSIPPNLISMLEGCASVSDRLGNLILFSDGVRLWYRPDQASPNAYTEITTPTTLLLGNRSSSQNVIFVPVPNNQDRYYIFTIDGKSGNSAGLYYSVVDLNDGAGGTPIFVPGQQNIVLLDHAGVAINDINYINVSEAITSSMHTNGVDYWIVVHIQNGLSGPGFMYSYLVSQTGIGTANDRRPSNNSSLNMQTVEIGTFDVTAYAKCIKISRGGLGISNIAMSAFFGGIYNGTFDRSTGNFLMQPNPIGYTPALSSPLYWGIEFSPDSNNLFYRRQNDLIKENFPVDINNFDVVTLANTGLELGMDNKVYFMSNNGTRLRVINNPDDFSNPMSFDTPIILPNNGRICLPQWVHKQSCEVTLTDDADIPPGYFDVNEQRSKTIYLTNTISGPAAPLNATRSVYHAGNFIEMLPENGSNLGFEAQYGSEFVAYIAPCDSGFAYRNSNTDTSPNQSTEKANVLSVSSKLQIYPNPSNTFVTIALDSSKLKSIVITSLDGKVILNQNVNSNSEQIDVSNYAKGLYLITVQTEDGKSIIKKFIKN